MIRWRGDFKLKSSELSDAFLDALKLGDRGNSWIESTEKFHEVSDDFGRTFCGIVLRLDFDINGTSESLQDQGFFNI